MAQGGSPAGTARYVFSVEFRLDTHHEGVSVAPARFETTMYRRADPPAQDGWLFFRDAFWHGELTDHEHFREVTADAIGVPVVTVSFRELQTDERYLEQLRAAIGNHLDEFNATSINDALSKYLGSSIRVRSPGTE